jgi:hypothetical protein
LELATKGLFALACAQAQDTASNDMMGQRTCDVLLNL